MCPDATVISIPREGRVAIACLEGRAHIEQALKDLPNETSTRLRSVFLVQLCPSALWKGLCRQSKWVSKSRMNRCGASRSDETNTIPKSLFFAETPLSSGHVARLPMLVPTQFIHSTIDQSPSVLWDLSRSKRSCHLADGKLTCLQQLSLHHSSLSVYFRVNNI